MLECVVRSSLLPRPLVQGGGKYMYEVQLGASICWVMYLEQDHLPLKPSSVTRTSILFRTTVGRRFPGAG